MVLAIFIVLCLMIKSVFFGGLYETRPAERYLEDGDETELSGYLMKIEHSRNDVLLYIEDCIVSIQSKDLYGGTVILKPSYEGDKIFAPSGPDPEGLEIGCLVLAAGKWEAFSPATNPGQFDEYGYYKSIGVDGCLRGAVRSVCNDSASYVRTGLSRIRNTFSRTIDSSILGEEDRAVLKAMVLGDKSALSPELRELYKNAGIIHLISISGLHITIIGMGLYRLMRKGGRTFLFSGAVSGTVMAAFVIMTGASVSSIRALISFIVLMGAEVLGRTADPLNTLSLSACILLTSSGALLYNTGFQLSFASVTGIALFLPKDSAGRGACRVISAIRTGLGLWLFTLPVILCTYSEFPLYSVLLNLPVVAAAPLLLTAGLGGTLIGTLIPAAGNVFFFAAGLVMQFNNLLCRLAAHLPFSTITGGRPGPARILVYYLGIIALLALRRREDAPSRLMGLKVLTVSLMLFTLLAGIRTGTVITFLDVGQGDSILIRCDNGSNIMIDAGSGNVSHVGDRRIIPCLKAYGISVIDRLLLTHPDADHINAVDEILDSNIRVGEILIAEVHSNDEAMVKLREKVKEFNEYSINKTKIRYIQRGDMFREGNNTFNVLNPRVQSNLNFDSVSESDIGQSSENDRNITSIVVEMEYEGCRVLFTGDLEKEGEDEVVSSGLLKEADILKVGHHGSKNATSGALLDLVKPEIAVISCGRKNQYGHPHRETLERLDAAGCTVFGTSTGGALEVFPGEKPLLRPFIQGAGPIASPLP